jgi:hypothetical protein
MYTTKTQSICAVLTFDPQLKKVNIFCEIRQKKITKIDGMEMIRNNRIRTHYWPWQPYWISNLHQNNRTGVEPSKEHSHNAKNSICQVVSKKKKVFE